MSLSLNSSLSGSICICTFGGLFPQIRQIDIDNFHAADIRDLSAALVPIQWTQPSHPPCQNVDSADCSHVPARHFSGKYANCAIFAVNSDTKISLISVSLW